ncbi:hypothetical protein PJ900_03120 (plasmid) [Tistrella mobilis]|uniref:Cupin domain-containing protein n=1 Tax=Tistrella mobilis TaxID=171437 RepID=A0A162LGV9_9PROT|nr:hypothetical protein [Tistrella mobilis]KYO54920.1 hypothetical protein AUP44_24525 [Tistrella mobilis]
MTPCVPTHSSTASAPMRAVSSRTRTGPDTYFTGEVKGYGQYQGDAPARIGGATVAFAPGARTAWHTHPLGQTLFISGRHLDGKGVGRGLSLGRLRPRISHRWA